MKKTVTIFGESGSVGLSLKTMLESHPEIELTETSKNPNQQKTLLQASDLVFLATPEDVSKEILAIRKSLSSGAKVIDCSHVYRCDPDWAYGLPELGAKQKEKISKAQYIANPGCHASAAILGLKPVTDAGIIHPACLPSIVSNTGYSGGGKNMIQAFESGDEEAKSYAFLAPHKHMPEIQMFGGFQDILFDPVVINQKKGILTHLHLRLSSSDISEDQIIECYQDYYSSCDFVSLPPAKNSIAVGENNDTNQASIYVTTQGVGLKVQVVLDNLIKGSAGVAIQNMNLALGFDETTGLL